MKVIDPPDAWAEIIAREHIADVVPEGFKTVVEIGRLLGRKVSSTREFCSKAVENGTLERRMIKIFTCGRFMPVPHYRPTNYGKPNQTPRRNR